jgi:ribulose-5-phosphate 4-epimerase/fuculose-1-phosphate aldolase
MKVLLVGGNFAGRTGIPKPSGVVEKLGEALKEDVSVDVVNGGDVWELESLDLNPYDLVIWMANVDNSQPKKYPTKRKGSVMVISKRMTRGRTELDAVARIFGMQANAVIGIKPDGEQFSFKLMDALGNLWVETEDIKELATAVMSFMKWNSSSRRVGTHRVEPEHLSEVVELNKVVADKFEAVKSRYFGNVSTRCMKMSPTSRSCEGDGKLIFVSKRNVSKQRLTTEDMIPVLQKDFNENGSDPLKYFGKDKPSVDTPIQMYLYKVFPEINHMIHGHAYIKGAPHTEHYYPCGDLRETKCVQELIEKINWDRTAWHGAINLKNHGFLIFADTLEHLERIVNEVELIERSIGFERIDD